MNFKKIILLAVLSPALTLAASGETVKAKPRETPAINLYVDISLGLISEDEAKEKTKKLKSDFKTTLKSETDLLTGDLCGVRQVSGMQFAALVNRTDEKTSFSATTIIGKTKDRAYLEVKIFLKSSKSYVTIVHAPLDDVPVETRKKL